MAPIIADDGLPDPPAALAIAWTQVAGPASAMFTQPASATTNVAFPVAGSWVLRVTASDGALSTHADIAVTVTTGSGGNQAPVVDAGPNQTIALSSAAALAGSITDDGLPNPPGSVTATWSVASGPAPGVLFADPHAPVTTATFLAPGTYALRLTADDGALTSSATVGIVVTDAAPALAAVSDRVITLGTRFRLQLQGRDTNVDDTLRYAIVGGPSGALIDAEGLVDWTPTAAQLGRHAFTVSVTDAAGHVATTSFGVEVVKLNQAPTLDAQADATLSPGASFTRTLHATDPDAGDVLTYALAEWTERHDARGQHARVDGPRIECRHVRRQGARARCRRAVGREAIHDHRAAGDDAGGEGRRLRSSSRRDVARTRSGRARERLGDRRQHRRGQVVGAGQGHAVGVQRRRLVHLRAPALLAARTSLLPHGLWGALVPDNTGFGLVGRHQPRRRRRHRSSRHSARPSHSTARPAPSCGRDGTPRRRHSARIA